MRRSLCLSGFFGLAVLSFTTESVKARVHEVWPTAKLTAKADIIVIARHISTKDAMIGEKAPEQFSDLVGVESRFKVLAVLKGKLEKQEITLFHFRYPKTAWQGEGRAGVARARVKVRTELISFAQTPDLDGPGLLRFERDPDEDPPRYLMFLKKRKDGRYECVSAQVDPDVSVNKLVGPSGDIEK
jgi:hypothetical protein